MSAGRTAAMLNTRTQRKTVKGSSDKQKTDLTDLTSYPFHQAGQQFLS